MLSASALYFCARASSKKIRTPPAAFAKSSKVSLALLTFVRKYVLCTLLRVVPRFIDHTYKFYVAGALRQVRARMCLSLYILYISTTTSMAQHPHNGIFYAISLVFANLRGHHSTDCFIAKLVRLTLKLEIASLALMWNIINEGKATLRSQVIMTYCYLLL